MTAGARGDAQEVARSSQDHRPFRRNGVRAAARELLGAGSAAGFLRWLIAWATRLIVTAAIGLLCATAARGDSPAPGRSSPAGTRATADPARDLIAERAVFIVRTGAVTIDTVTTQAFEPVAQPYLFFGNGKDPVWIRLRLKPSAGGDAWWLTLGPPFTHSATLYTPSASGGWQTETFGIRHAFSDRRVPSLSFIAPLQLQAGEATTLYLKLDTPTGTAEVRVVHPEAALAMERTQQMAFTLYLGVVIMMLVVSLLAYVTTRQNLWLSAAALDFAAALSASIQGGLVAVYLASNAGNVLNHLHPLATFGHMLCAAYLCVQLIKLIKAPAWTQLNYWFQIVLAPCLVALHFFGETALALKVTNLVALVGLLVGVPPILVSKCRGDVVMVRAVKLLLAVAALPLFAFLSPWPPFLSISQEWRGFAAMPFNLVFISLGAFIAFRLSYLESLDKRRLAAEAREAQRRNAALAESRAKTAFLVYMSHEIRTPLNAVVGLAELAGSPGLPDAQREDYLHMLKESAESLTSVISGTLDLSKIEAGKLDIEPVDFNLNDWLDALHATHFALAERKGLVFAIHKGETPLGVVRGDPVRLRQILGNFLSNALKFTDAGEVTLVVHRLAPDRYRFDVKDSGRGLTEEEQARLFTAYAQSGSDAYTKARGTGMGLAICRELARLMQGEVGVESKPGAGSCFWLELPMPEVSRPAGMMPDAVAAAAALRGRRILVADDDALNRTLMEALLRREGADPVTAADGAQALASIQQAFAAGQPFDVVFLDVHMHGMGGLEAARRIRQLGPAGKVTLIALTGSVLTEERQEALASGMDELLPKPVRLARLREAVHLHVKRQAHADPHPAPDPAA